MTVDISDIENIIAAEELASDPDYQLDCKREYPQRGGASRAELRFHGTLCRRASQ